MTVGNVERELGEADKRQKMTWTAMAGSGRLQMALWNCSCLHSRFLHLVPGFRMDSADWELFPTRLLHPNVLFSSLEISVLKPFSEQIMSPVKYLWRLSLASWRNPKLRELPERSLHPHLPLPNTPIPLESRDDTSNWHVLFSHAQLSLPLHFSACPSHLSLLNLYDTTSWKIFLNDKLSIL